MTKEERKAMIAQVERRYQVLAPYLTEQSSRVWAAAEALAIGRGGTAIVSEAAGVSRTTITKAKREVGRRPSVRPARQRRKGGGRTRLTVTDPTLLEALDVLIDPCTRGDPESPLRWTCKSTYNLAEALQKQGHRVSQRTVYRLLDVLGYSLQANRKAEEGADHPDRDAQFQFIADKVQRFQKNRQPVISVDLKKKENLGNYANAGREWEPGGQPHRVRTHDFPDPQADKACP